MRQMYIKSAFILFLLLLAACTIGEIEVPGGATASAARAPEPDDGDIDYGDADSGMRFAFVGADFTRATYDPGIITDVTRTVVPNNFPFILTNGRKLGTFHFKSTATLTDNMVIAVTTNAFRPLGGALPGSRFGLRVQLAASIPRCVLRLAAAELPKTILT